MASNRSEEKANGIASFEQLLEEQRKGAVGQRLEMLGRDLTGTKILAEAVLLPTLGKLDGVSLEHEFVTASGIRIYVDAVYPPLLAAFESDGFASHGEKLTRDRFSFERMRMRTVSKMGYRYFPFSYDELDKKPEACRRDVYELLGRYGSTPGSRLFELPVMEREILRYGMTFDGGFSLSEACHCLQMRRAAVSKVLRRMVEKCLLEHVGEGELRYHFYRLTEKGRELFMR